MNKLNCSAQRKQELVNCYEELRNLALRKSKASVDNSTAGYSILLFRGMSAWINTFLSSELIYPTQSSYSHLETESNLEKKHLNFPHNIHKEVMMILTNMVLSHQQDELRNQYV